VTDIRPALEAALAGGPERHQAKLAEQEKLPVRERIERLIDPGSFAEEALLAADLPRGVEALDADVVEVRRTVHRRPRVGLVQHEQRLLAGLVGHHRRQLADRVRHVRVAAQDAVPRAGDAPQDLVVALVLEVVLPVAEEREVVVGQPAEQRLALLDLFGRQRGRVALQVLDDLRSQPHRQLVEQ